VISRLLSKGCSGIAGNRDVKGYVCALVPLTCCVSRAVWWRVRLQAAPSIGCAQLLTVAPAYADSKLCVAAQLRQGTQWLGAFMSLWAKQPKWPALPWYITDEAAAVPPELASPPADEARCEAGLPSAPRRLCILCQVARVGTMLRSNARYKCCSITGAAERSEC